MDAFMDFCFGCGAGGCEVVSVSECIHMHVSNPFTHIMQVIGG